MFAKFPLAKSYLKTPEDHIRKHLIDDQPFDHISGGVPQNALDELIRFILSTFAMTTPSLTK